MQISNEKDQTERGKMYSAQFEERGSTRKCNVAKPNAQGENKTDGLLRTKNVLNTFMF